MIANQVWAPHQVKHIVALENVQQCVTRMILGLREVASPEDRLKRLKLPTLSYYHAKGDMIQTYMIITGV